MPRFHIACCRTQFGLYFLDAENEMQAKEMAQGKLRTGQEFDALIGTEVGIGEIKNIDDMDILRPAGYDEDIGELVHIPKNDTLDAMLEKADMPQSGEA